MKYLVELDATGVLVAQCIIEASSADEAGEIAISKRQELDWEAGETPHMKDIGAPIVDEVQ